MRLPLDGRAEGSHGPPKPRYLYWFKAWIWITLLYLGAIWYFRGFADGTSGFWKVAQIFYPLLAALSVAVSAHRERAAPPRRYSFWDDGSEEGATIRHALTREVLVHVYRKTFTAEDLLGITLEQADLRYEKLEGLDLRGARLRGANLQGAHLQKAALDGADLAGCQLGRAWLYGASFQEANLRGAQLGGASLIGASFRGADLRGAQFGWSSGASLQRADLRHAIYNAATRWPHGFRPDHHDCVFDPTAEHSFPIPVRTISNELPSLPVAAAEPSSEVVRAETRA